MSSSSALCPCGAVRRRVMCSALSCTAAVTSVFCASPASVATGVPPMRMTLFSHRAWPSGRLMPCGSSSERDALWLCVYSTPAAAVFSEMADSWNAKSGSTPSSVGCSSACGPVMDACQPLYTAVTSMSCACALKTRLGFSPLAAEMLSFTEMQKGTETPFGT